MGKFEVDKHPFDAQRVRGKKGTEKLGFELLKRGGLVFVKVVSDCSKESLMLLIKGKFWRKQQSVQTVGR